MTKRLIRNGNVTTGIAVSTQISNSQPRQIRKVLELTNLNASGGATVYISVGEEAAANQGRSIVPQQTITWSEDGGYIPPNFIVNGIASAATVIAVYEEIEVQE